jgi:hypothetical protein
MSIDEAFRHFPSGTDIAAETLQDIVLERIRDGYQHARREPFESAPSSALSQWARPPGRNATKQRAN